MRIALVSPYSWTYPGGVTRHIEALAEQFIAEGHEVRVLAPFDPPDRTAAVSHRGAHPQPVEAPDYLISLGRTLGFNANGAQSNLSVTPVGQAKLTRALRSGNFDVVHIHEPVAPLIGWVASAVPGVPLVGTFHSYSTKPMPNYIATVFGARAMLNHLHVRIAVSEAAAWTGRRWFGGRYRVIPNGVHIDEVAPDVQVTPPLLALTEGTCEVTAAAQLQGDAHVEAARPLKLLFVGQSVARKGLPMLLRAYEALREHVPAELTVIGPSAEELAPLLMDAGGVRALGKVSDEIKHAELAEADVLVAPSLGGESFGMVLTEAMAAGTTVVASDIAGYRDVVSSGRDGILVEPGDAQVLAETLRDLYYDPKRRHDLAVAATATVQRFSWKHVAAEVMQAYEAAINVPAPDTAFEHAMVRIGASPADLQPPVRARRLPSLEKAPARTRGSKRWIGYARRGLGLGVVFGGLLLAYLALHKIGITSITRQLLNSSPAYVVLGLVVMCSAMMMRAISWQAVLQAALPKIRVKLGDATQGTMIGVLMSSTLPARLGEPARALVVARRTGRPREHLPIVLGTVVAQTVLNIVALIILGVITFSSVNFFAGRENTLLFVAIAPAALLLAVIIAPIIVRFGSDSTRLRRVRNGIQAVQRALLRVRTGLAVFRDPRLGAKATFFQMLAWALQAASCWLLLIALGLGSQTSFVAAAAVLFAVNVSAVLPVTPANLGVFQAACAFVLHSGWHIPVGTGIAYGVILQAVEVATAIIMGMPALLKEGMSWREVRLRAMNAAPVKLPPRVPTLTMPQMTVGPRQAAARGARTRAGASSQR